MSPKAHVLGIFLSISSCSQFPYKSLQYVDILVVFRFDLIFRKIFRVY